MNRSYSGRRIQLTPPPAEAHPPTHPTAGSHQQPSTSRDGDPSPEGDSPRAALGRPRRPRPDHQNLQRTRACEIAIVRRSERIRARKERREKEQIITRVPHVPGSKHEATINTVDQPGHHRYHPSTGKGGGVSEPDKEVVPGLHSGLLFQPKGSLVLATSAWTAVVRFEEEEVQLSSARPTRQARLRALDQHQSAAAAGGRYGAGRGGHRVQPPALIDTKRASTFGVVVIGLPVPELETGTDRVSPPPPDWHH